MNNVLDGNCVRAGGPHTDGSTVLLSSMEETNH